MENNTLSLNENLIWFQELRHELSLIQAKRETEHDLTKDQKHMLAVEAKQVDDYLINLLSGRHHG